MILDMFTISQNISSEFCKLNEALGVTAIFRLPFLKAAVG